MTYPGKTTMSDTNNLLPSEAQQEIEKNFRWNFTVNMLDGASFWLGASFISSSVILPLYLSHFTSNPILIGLIPFFATAGYLLPQLFTANVVQRAPIKKIFPVNIGFFLERLPIIPLAPTAWLLATNHPVGATIAFLACYGWHCIGAGTIGVGWQDMIAKLIPVDRRGRFFGISNFIGNGTGILGALVVPFVLAKFAFPNGFVIAFAIAALFIFISWLFISMSREPAVYSNKPVTSQSDYFRSLPGILRKDHNFLMYLIAQIVFSLSSMANGFLVVYAVKTWNMTDSSASGFTIALQVGTTLAYLIFGFLSDRKGHKLTLEICVLISILSLVLAFLAPNPIWFYLILFLRGAVTAGTFISGISIVYEFTDPENRPTYIGLANTIPGIASGIAPLLGGWLAGTVNYKVLFITAAVIAVISFALLTFSVREPRKVQVKDVDLPEHPNP
jgi:MFS family permease